MTHPELIVATLDRHLDHEVSLVLFGRAAIGLGFEAPPAATAVTMDVDCILPQSSWPALQADENFWEAVEETNGDLSAQNLYLTHLFDEMQVFLRPEWESHVVPIERPRLRFLHLFRPAALDLILTKMMRGDDAEDMADVAFLIKHDAVSQAQLQEAFLRARLPEIPELHEAFAKAKPLVLALASG